MALKKTIILLIFLLGTALLLCSPASAKEAKDFAQWLGKIEAYDVLEQELSSLPEQTTDVVLRRARAVLELRQPKKALRILDNLETFSSSENESSRFFLVADCQRFLGNLPEAVIAMRKGLLLLEASSQAKFLKKHPDVSAMWKDVWRVWYWEYVNSPLGSDTAAQLENELEQTLSVASALWPGTSFWEAALPALSGFKASRSSGFMQQMKFSLPALQVTPEQRMQIVKGLCAVGIGLPDLISPITLVRSESSSQDAVRAASTSDALNTFWSATFETMQNGTATNPQELQSYPIADAFAGSFDHMKVLSDSGRWRVANPGVPGWGEFVSDLSELPKDKARDRIRQELDSTLITPETAQALRLCAFAFAVLEDDQTGYTALWKELKNAPLLPLSFSAAAMILFELPPETLPAAANADTQKLLRRLAGGAGLDALGGFAPFWLECSKKSGLSLASAVQTFPLDPLLNLALAERQWQSKRSAALAKRTGFLFPNTKVGTQSLLYLAQLAGKSGSLHTTAFYLNRLDSRKLTGKFRADFLQAKAALEIDLGRNKEALKSYMELVEIEGERLTPVKRLKLALLAQQQGKMQWAEKVLKELWNEREELEKPVQAEVLFWLAEGAGAMGRLDEALEKYLRVAWQYRSENIWAVTSMYRAAVIYERSRRYDTAKILLKSVIRNAGRKSQKEAAQERLKAVDAELNKRLKKKGNDRHMDFSFPF